MLTIEHEFDHTAITLIDEGGCPLREDVVVNAYEDRVEIEQLSEDAATAKRITLSLRQLHELAAALNLPEGVYMTTFLHQGSPTSETP